MLRKPAQERDEKAKETEGAFARIVLSLATGVLGVIASYFAIGQRTPRPPGISEIVYLALALAVSMAALEVLFEYLRSLRVSEVQRLKREIIDVYLSALENSPVNPAWSGRSEIGPGDPASRDV